MNKIQTLSVIQKSLSKLKKQGKTVVFTNGCFDLLHPGHLKLLQTAKQKGDILIVGLNSDSSVRKIKGSGRPILDEKARSQLLCAMSVVDFVVIFKDKTPYNLINQLKPNLIVKGKDWKSEEIIGRDSVKKILRVKHYCGYSTSKIIEKIRRSAG